MTGKWWSDLRTACVYAATLSTAALIASYWPNWTWISKALGLAYAGVATAIGLLTELRSGDPRRITTAGRVALGLGIATVLTNAGVMVVEQVRQRASVSESIRQQTAVIENLRQLVAPLTDQISATVTLSIPSGHDSVKEMAAFLNQGRGRNRYVGLPQLLRSNDARESAFAQLISLTNVFLYFCRDESCIEALRNQHGDDPAHPRVLLSGEIAPSRPEFAPPGDQPPFQVAVDSRRETLMLDGWEQVFKVTLVDQRVNFDESENGFHTADNLPGTTLVLSVSLGGGFVHALYTVDAVVLRKKNRMFLQATDFKDRSKIEGGSYQNFLVAKLGDRWQ